MNMNQSVQKVQLALLGPCEPRQHEASGVRLTRAEIQHMNSGLQLKCLLCEGSRRCIHSLSSLKAAPFVHALHREKALMVLSCLLP